MRSLTDGFGCLVGWLVKLKCVVVKLKFVLHVSKRARIVDPHQQYDTMGRIIFIIMLS